MKTTISIVLVLALGLVSDSKAAESIWTTKADMPTRRWELSTCMVDGKIYAIGGAGPVYQPLRTVEEYDPETDTWTTKSPMPTARQGLTTNVVNGKIYAIGGGSSSSSSYSSSSVRTFSAVEEYDPVTDTWKRKADMPTARGWHSTSVLDGRIYVIGGASPTPSQGTTILTVEVYDPATDSWTLKGDIPERIAGGSSNVVDGKIYAFGGYWGTNKVHQYDPVTDTWIQKAGMPTKRAGHSTSVANGKIYAIGGHPGWSPYTAIATVDIYDPATDTWTTAPDIPTGRCGGRTSVVDGKIYAIGGYTGAWLSQICATVEEYDPGFPLPDFNCDYRIDTEDLLILIEYWGTDNSLCDVAPPVRGDGVVDRADLEVLMSYWGQEVDDPRLVAHWKLDEAEGDVAYDSAGENDGMVLGRPVWQPEGGEVDGGLEFDGIDDLIMAEFVIDPEDGPFSVFAWIKGGAPGQVIISQQSGVGWLQVDADGTLMTELMSSGGRAAGTPLYSETVITDGNWHRIGFVWNGSQRTLYADDIPVALDSQSDLGGSTGGLVIGVGKAQGSQTSTFWSGMIDDVRIYDRVVEP